MLCLKCEVLRARLIAAGMVIVGKTHEQIAAHLSSRYSAKYFVDTNAVWRDNNPSPIRILE